MDDSSDDSSQSSTDGSARITTIEKLAIVQLWTEVERAAEDVGYILRGQLKSYTQTRESCAKGLEELAAAYALPSVSDEVSQNQRDCTANVVLMRETSMALIVGFARLVLAEQRAHFASSCSGSV